MSKGHKGHGITIRMGAAYDEIESQYGAVFDRPTILKTKNGDKAWNTVVRQLGELYKRRPYRKEAAE